MDSEILLTALGKQLDALNSVISWASGLALITAWAGLQRSPEISIFSMKIERKDALYLLGAAFLYVNIAAIFFFVRIADLLMIIESSSLSKALTIIGTHAWPFNPYAYFGNSLTSVVTSNCGYGALIAIWWLGLTALTLVQDDKAAIGFWIIVIVFFAVGLISMGAIQLGFEIISVRLHELRDMELRNAIQSQAVPRTVLTLFGIGVGGAMFIISQLIQIRGNPRI
jgi:hypothetical protein